MADVIQIERYRWKRCADRGFARWRERFRDEFTEDTRLTEVSDATLSTLLNPVIDAENVFYEFISAVLYPDAKHPFFDLDGMARMNALEISLFLLDQARFECMRRMGWVDQLPCQQFSLVELVLRHDEIRYTFRPRIPQVTEAHPDFEEYRRLHPGERETFIRKQIPKAVQAFEKRFLNTSR